MKGDRLGFGFGAVVGGRRTVAQTKRLGAMRAAKRQKVQLPAILGRTVGAEMRKLHLGKTKV